MHQSHPRHRMQKRTPQVRRNTGTPCALVYGLYALSPESGLVSLRRLKLIIFRLDPSVGRSGPRDFAVRLDPFVLAKNATGPKRPSHPASHARDDRETPRWRRRDGQEKIIYLRKTEVEYF